ncbi:hypothetical protein SAMN05444359_14024 [Neolewinella agarilytica]|uniref:Uncharacterized protein n=1 Tax=Neolewinella agarilytica TaxID=478744 RepID=A0A1H9NYD5_9BACT|nr:hypothetical protein SAMN05444359_14024 [Neolewinella agarilytica]
MKQGFQAKKSGQPILMIDCPLRLNEKVNGLLADDPLYHLTAINVYP